MKRYRTRPFLVTAEHINADGGAKTLMISMRIPVVYNLSKTNIDTMAEQIYTSLGVGPGSIYVTNITPRP